MNVYTSDTVLKIKKKLHQLEGIEPSKQRWFYAGKILTDKTTIGEAKIPKGYVVQVILPQPTPVENQKAVGSSARELFCYDIWQGLYSMAAYLLVVISSFVELNSHRLRCNLYNLVSGMLELRFPQSDADAYHTK